MLDVVLVAMGDSDCGSDVEGVCGDCIACCIGCVDSLLLSSYTLLAFPVPYSSHVCYAVIL